MFYSIECNMSTKSFPKSDNIDDNIISIVIKDTSTLYLLTTYDVKQSELKDIIIFKVDNEKELILKFMHLIMEIKPEYIIGYNIAMFDNNYLINRIKILNLYDTFKNNDFKFKRHVFGDQEYYSVDYINSQNINIYDNIKDNIDLPNYRFSHVCKELLKKDIELFPAEFYYNAKFKSIDELTIMSQKMAEKINLTYELYDKYFET